MTQTMPTQTEQDKTSTPENTMKFSDLQLGTDLIDSIHQAGFESPRPIQQEAIPHILGGKDLIGRAQTGSGKTAAFVLPAIQQRFEKPRVSTLVLVPTRELAEQVVQEFLRFGKPLGLKVVSIVGGQPGMRQIELFNRGVHVVVATPGRMLDHLSSGRLKKCEPSMVVLDEADEMLDMGFIEDIRMILSKLPEKRQTLLFSATMPPAIAKLAKEHLKDPVEVSCLNPGERHANIEQILHLVPGRQREQALVRSIRYENPEKAIIFCRTRRDADELNERLNSMQLRSLVLHGDLSQATRDQAIRSIREGRSRFLIATDVASRGLDIPNISHVFNYHIPENEERYTHRIGRTGRGGANGKAITFATPIEFRNGHFLKRNIQKGLQLSVLPLRSEVEKKQNEFLLKRIETTEVRPECESMLEGRSDSEIKTLAMHMLSLLSHQHRVSGPQEVGLTAEELQQIASGGRSHRSKDRFNRRPGRGNSSNRSRSFPPRNGRGKDRPQQSRRSRPPKAR